MHSQVKCILVAPVCVSVSVRVFPSPHAYITASTRCNLAEWYGVPPSCALLGGFAICAQVLLLLQYMHLM